jgi:Rieske Fe-S protein
MALGKKKDGGDGIVAQLGPDDGSPLDELEVAEAGASEAAEAAAEAVPEAAPAAAAPAAAAPGEVDLSADSLLNMFQTTQMELEDRSAVLELAGDVEIDDLLEELQTVAVALGVVARG